MSIATYATFLNAKVVIPSQKTEYYAVQRDHLIDFLRPHVSRIAFDEKWYLSAHPDIAEAIKSGRIASAHEHYVTSGYYEHRLPYEIPVQEEWYLAQYPDVREAVEKATSASGREHFYRSGFREGRLPFPGFSLKVTA
jgi:hypothetical protein